MGRRGIRAVTSHPLCRPGLGRLLAGFLAYARSLDVWRLSGKVLAVLPFAEASGSAKVAGQGRDRQVFGLAEPLLRISANFFGAPALSMEDLPTYNQDIIVGGYPAGNRSAWAITRARC